MRDKNNNFWTWLTSDFNAKKSLLIALILAIGFWGIPLVVSTEFGASEIVLTTISVVGFICMMILVAILVKKSRK